MSDNKNKQINSIIREVVKGASISAVGNVIGILLGFLTGLVLARILGAERYGDYVLTLSILGFVSVFSISGFNRGMLQYVSVYRIDNNVEKIKGVITFLQKIGFFISFSFAVMVFIFSNKIADNIFHKPLLASSLKIVAFSVIFITIGDLFTFVLQAYKKIDYQVLQKTIIQPISLLLLILIFYLFHGQYYSTLIAYFTSMIIYAFAGYYFVKKLVDFKVKGLLLKEEKKDIIHYSVPLLLTGIIQFIMFWIDVILVGYFLKSKDVGIYKTCTNFALLIVYPLGSFNIIFAPIIAELFHSNKTSELDKIFKIISKWSFIISFPLFITMVYFGKILLNLYGDAFTVGYKALIIVAIGQMINSGVGSVALILVMAKKTKTVLYNSIALCILSLITNYFLTPRYGIAGAALATCISLTLINIVSLIEVKYYFNIHPYKVSFLKPLFSGILAIMIVSIYNILVAPLSFNVSSFCLIAAYGIVYLLMMYYLGFDEEDLFVINGIKKKLSLDK